MSVHEPAAALTEPDGDALFRKLHGFASADKQLSSASLPATAERYLKAFCDGASSTMRRRWIGVALRRMICTSTDVVNHLKTLRRELAQLGQVILGRTDEETKIMAGVIIREMMEQGIDYRWFWPSDKVPNNAPNFPQEYGPKWMGEFQTFLDTLGDLAIMESATDPAILYAVSLVTSDNFRWRDSDAAELIALLQNDSLTIILPDLATLNLDFMDIPLKHVQNVRRQRSILDDSQSLGTKHEPWEVVVSLRPGPWTYRLNTSSRKGKEVTILFANVNEAQECENCIREVINSNSTGLRTSRTSFALDVRNKTPEVRENGANGGIPAASTSSETSENFEAVGRAPSADDDARSRGDDNEVTVASRPASTEGARSEKDEMIEISSTKLFSSPESQYRSPSNETRDHPSVVDEQPSEIPPPAPTALPKIKKAAHKNNITPKQLEGRHQEDEFDFPEEPPRMVRPSQASKKGSQAGRAKPAISRPSTALNGMTKGKQIALKPKSKPRQQVNDMEDEDDPISSQVIQPVPRKHTNANAAVQPTQPSAQGADTDERPEKSKGEARSSGLPDVSNVVHTKAAAGRVQMQSDPFAIPQDEESNTQPAKDNKWKGKLPQVSKLEGKLAAMNKPKRKPQLSQEPEVKLQVKRSAKDKSTQSDGSKATRRTKRKVAQDVNYKESDSSDFEPDSDHDEAEPKKKPRYSRPKASVPESAAKPKPKAKSAPTKAAATNANSRSISPAKHSLLAKLTKSQATPIESKSSKANVGTSLTKESSESLGENQEAPNLSSPDVFEPRAAPEPEPEQNASTNSKLLSQAERDASPRQSTPALESEEQFANQNFHSFINYEQHPQSSPLLADQTAGGPPPTEAPNAEVETAKSTTAVDHSAMEPAVVSTNQRKRSAEGTPPSTPQRKRTKREHQADRGNAGQTEPPAPATFAPPRVLTDPSSPLGRQRRPSFQPTTKENVRDSKGSRYQSASSTFVQPFARPQDPKASPYQYGSSPIVQLSARSQEFHSVHSIKHMERRHTPLHQHAQRTHSGSSANAEILSSNSKPMPASPHAESTAISGHADENHVNMEKEIGDYETARRDPFQQRSKTSRSTAFIRRLTEGEPTVVISEIPSVPSPERPVEAQVLESPLNAFRSDSRALKGLRAQNPPLNVARVVAPGFAKIDKKSAQAPEVSKQEPVPNPEQGRSDEFEESVVSAPPQGVEKTQSFNVHEHNEVDTDMDMEGDETLVAPGESPFTPKPAPLHLRSSPPGDFPSSSHSSTSAELEVFEADEMQWEASLQPHQRSIHDQLIRVSKQVVRHIVDKESAVDDIAETYAADGAQLLNALVERHSESFEFVLKDTERKRSDMRKEYEGLAKRMAREREKYGPKN